MSILPVPPRAAPEPDGPSPALVVTVSPFAWSLVPRVSFENELSVTFGPVTITLR